MDAVNYSHYKIESINSQEEYEALPLESADPSFEDKTVIFVRDLGIFETLKAFFELLLDSFYSCFISESKNHIFQRNQAWEALYNREAVRIITLGEEVKLTERSLFPTVPHELNSTILAAFDLPLLCLASQVCKTWRVICRKNCYWQNFFPEITIPKGISIKNFCSTHYVSTPELLINKVIAFIDALEANQCKMLRFYRCASKTNKEPGNSENKEALNQKFNSFIELCYDDFHLENAQRCEDEVLLISSDISLENIPCDHYQGAGKSLCELSHVPTVLNQKFKAGFYARERFFYLSSQYLKKKFEFSHEFNNWWNQV